MLHISLVALSDYTMHTLGGNLFVIVKGHLAIHTEIEPSSRTAILCICSIQLMPPHQHFHIITLAVMENVGMSWLLEEKEACWE